MTGGKEACSHSFFLAFVFNCDLPPSNSSGLWNAARFYCCDFFQPHLSELAPTHDYDI